MFVVAVSTFAARKTGADENEIVVLAKNEYRRMITPAAPVVP